MYLRTIHNGLIAKLFAMVFLLNLSVACSGCCETELEMPVVDTSSNYHHETERTADSNKHNEISCASCLLVAENEQATGGAQLNSTTYVVLPSENKSAPGVDPPFRPPITILS